MLDKAERGVIEALHARILEKAGELKQEMEQHLDMDVPFVSKMGKAFMDTATAQGQLIALGADVDTLQEIIDGMDRLIQSVPTLVVAEDEARGFDIKEVVKSE